MIRPAVSASYEQERQRLARRLHQAEAMWSMVPASDQVAESAAWAKAESVAWAKVESARRSLDALMASAKREAQPDATISAQNTESEEAAPDA
ncbi:MAG: hypothetical protein ACYCU5_14665 [Actinomycetes bacterium]